jgi:hypothetical protein
MTVSNGLGNRQSQAGTPLLPGASWIKTAKAIKDALLLNRWNPRPRVTNG